MNRNCTSVSFELLSLNSRTYELTNFETHICRGYAVGINLSVDINAGRR
jgi:hypothetical protein